MIKQSDLRKGRMTLDANRTILDIMENKNKEISRESQTWFRKRQVDAFLIGAARAFYQQRPPLKFPEKSQIVEPIPFYELKDKKLLTLIIQTIAYAHMIRETSNDEKQKENTHLVLLDLSKCISIVEEYFNGGWLYPVDENFKKLISIPFPDSEIMRELKALVEIDPNREE